MSHQDQFELDDDHLRAFIGEEAYGSHESKWSDVRTGYAHLQENSPCTTEDLAKAVSSTTRYGEDWLHQKALAAIRAGPGVQYRGWTLRTENPRTEEEVEELAEDLIPSSWRGAKQARKYLCGAYRELAEADSGEAPTTIELHSSARRRANAYFPSWSTVEEKLREIDEVSPPTEPAWFFEGGEGSE